MHVHILGICGTFMGGLALLAREQGCTVSGADKNVYPPMSNQLQAAGIELIEGYEVSQVPAECDCIIVGNVMTRGNPIIEHILNKKIPFMSGPEWLYKNILHNRWVLAVSGTHGKTSTSSMLAWILEYAGHTPGFLIGGIAHDLGVSARLGVGEYFVVEADEYDSAFFDKRSKFVHYRPKTLIINNIEFDHADIFQDIASIQQQFHHLIRIVPSEGKIIYNKQDVNIQTVLNKGVWSELETFGITTGQWQAATVMSGGQQFTISNNQETIGTLRWGLLGEHNVLNALAAIAAAYHAGVAPTVAMEALQKFSGIKRRLELKGEKKGVKIFEDFAHHPTAIHSTMQGLRDKYGQDCRIHVVVDIRSNTMKLGHHQETLPGALQLSTSYKLFYDSSMSWDINVVLHKTQNSLGAYTEKTKLFTALAKTLEQVDIIVIMSNGALNADELLEFLNLT